MPLYQILIFLSLISGVSFGLHLYIQTRLPSLIIPFSDALGSTIETLTEHSGGWAILLALSGLTPLYFMLGKWISPRRWRILGWLSSGWMGMMALLLIYGGLHHLIDALHQAFTDAPLPPVWGGVTLSLVITLWLYGTWNATRPPLLREVKVSIPDLPSDLEGFTIAQVSDLHVGPVIGRAYVERLRARCEALKPDLIVITGDLIDGEVSQLAEELEPLLSINTERPLYFVTGNHELFSGVDPWVDHLKERGVRVLENEHVTLTHGQAQLNLVGVEDWEAKRLAPHRRPHLRGALEGADLNLPTILLAHQPKMAQEASTQGIDLQLSGHTHGGQIFPIGLPVYIDQKYFRGLYRIGDMTLYVSEGTGYWGPSLRVGSRSELTLIELTSSAP
jgi:uncharacterized protein